MAAPHNVELEAAKFLQKLIHESTDEPARLATKLYVILQHMKASGKENSMPYQVISRAMETVINQHGLDIEALTSSRVPSSTEPQGESSTTHAAGSSQALPISDPKSGMTDNDTTKTDGFGSCRPPTAPNSLGPDLFQGSGSQRSGRSFDHESPSSIDTKSTNSHSQDRRETASWEQQGAQKNSKRASVKRKKSDSSAMEPLDDSIQQPDSHNTVPEVKKERLTSKVEMPGSFTGLSESWKQGFQGAANFREKAALGHLMSPNQVNVPMANFNLASRSDAAGMQMSADRPLQIANPTFSEVGGLRSPATRDTGKAPAITSMPFKEHHLKQLRAQCLVFLAFRNGLAPKRLHLEIALGNILTQEGTIGSVDGAQNELTSDRGKQPTTIESSCSAEATLARVNPAQIKNERVAIGTAAAGCGPDVDAVLNETKSLQAAGVKMGILENASHIDAQKHNPLGRGTFEAETQSQEVSNSSVLLTAGLQLDRSNIISPAVHSREDSLQLGGTNQGDNVLATNNPLKPEMARWSAPGQNDFSHSALPASVPYELGSSKDSSTNVSQHDGDILHAQRAGIHLSTSWNAIRVTEDDNGALDKTMSATDGSKVVAGFDSSYICRSSSPLGSEPEDEDKSVSAGMAPSPKQTLSEKWIMACQKRKVVNEQKWVRKLQKADQRIAYRFSELKETVSSSEDISAKTRSVIELKKLQLLELQRRLRSNIMNDFFKPVQSEMDQLKSIKKHRIGRRMKHVEKYEQKMKEERQKRIRERQKEFFSEIEVHRERLEDVFKFKRERCKGFNRYVKEFHKRKERIHREKIDRIQREKINLLKINDVEGYLRMVQDAKSDRVKQLLKETEKYLQKLGSKLQEAKTSAREVDIDENHIATFDASSENAAETEDDTDQAKHYKESNEKYYLIAHSIKESITEQPAGIQGGKLREYQMNGLRWLVSLYNNHLNGILADEMGLGKTVQVISLLCYLMEAKNDRGPFLVVVPSSVLPGWEREMSFWAPGINKIIYAGPPEERRRLFKESIVHQKFNVLLTTYEYLMNKHDRPKLSKIHWHYVIIDEGHRIKNASCKLNADLKHYHSSHRLLLTGTPLQNSLEELWALLNFLLPNIFNSSEDFSQWFNKPFEGNGDNSPDEALLSEEENLLIINRLHQVLRPFVLRRLKHKVENELPEKIERLVRCEASAYQKLLMTRVEENLGSLGMTKGRAIHNTVMELRNICNHPYISHLHVEEVDSLIPKHFLPPIIRLCGKLEMLDRLLPKLKETNHRVLFFSTMTRLLDIMEDYLVWKQYRYLRLDGHTSGQDRGALIEKFNQPDSPFFIFLLSIRAGGVGVNLQAADTVIIFDTDWNPQVDLQAQARAHRIGQKKDVLVLRLETVKSVEEQVRAAAEHKLGVANQSITAGFFDNNTSAEDRREYLESLLRESKKEEAAPVLDDDSLNDILARSESEIEVFEAIDQKRREEEMATWKTLVMEHGGDKSEALPPPPSRLVTDDDLKAFYEAMKIHEVPTGDASSSSGVKRKGGYVGGFDSQHYGRGKRAREVRSYEEQWSEEEFEKLCQSEYPETIKLKDEEANVPQPAESGQKAIKVEIPLQSPQPTPPSFEPSLVVKKEVTPPVKRGRGRPKRTPSAVPPVGVSLTRNTIAMREPESQPQKEITSTVTDQSRLESSCNLAVTKDTSGGIRLVDAISPKRQGRKGQTCQNNMSGELGTETIRRRGRKPSSALPPVPTGSPVQDLRNGEQLKQPSSDTCVSVNTSPKVTSDNTSADDSRGSLPKCSEGSDILSSKDTKPLELAAENNSFDASLEAAASPKHKETAKHEALSQSQNTPVQQHMVMLGGTLVENPKLNEKPVKNVISDSSAVNSAPRESQASPGSTALSVGGGIPVLKADLSKDSPQPAASNSEVQPSSTTSRASRRQSVKPQNAAEPARRRGRKRGPSVAADSTLPFVQDQSLHEPLKITSTMVTHVAPPTNMGAVTVPVTPLISVSVPQTDSAAVTVVSGSVLHESVGFVSSDPSSLQPSPVLSGAANIPSNTRRTSADLQTKGQAQGDKCTETVPRRRGRKKSTVSPVGQYTFSRQPDGKHGDLAECKVISTRSRQVNISQPPSTQGDIHSATPFASLASRDSVAVPNPCIQQSPSTKADGIDKPLDTRHTSTLEEMKLVVCPAEFPPISSKGKTNVIVLALDATCLDVDPIAVGDRNMHDNKEICNLQNRSTPGSSMLKPKFSRSEVIHATGQEVAKLDEELSAPPGFETSRLCKSNNMVTKSGENNGLGMADSPDTKMGTIVLGLKSAFQSSAPSSFACKNITEKEELSKIHSLKNSGQETVVQTLPEDCSAIVDAATDKVTSCQPEEDMLAPPGFDIPQQRLTEKEAAKTLACDDYQASDMLTESSVSVRVEEDCRALGDRDTLDICDTPTTSTSVGFTNGAASAVDPKEEKFCQEPISGDSGHDARDTPLAVCVMDSDTTVASTLQVEEKGEIVGPGSAEQNLVDSSTSSVEEPSNAEAKTLELKEEEELHEPCNTVQNPVDASTSSVANALELKKRQESHGPDSDDIGHETTDGQLALSVLDSDTVATPTLHLNGKGDSCGPSNNEQNAMDASTACIDSPFNATTSALEPKEKDESHGPCNTEQNVVDASTACVDSPCNVTKSVLELKQQEESHGPSNSKQNVVDASTACVDGPYNATTSALEQKEQEESHGSDNSEKNVVDTSTAGVDSPCNATTSYLEMKQQEELHGAGNTEQNVVDASAACVDGPSSGTTSALESNEQEESHGPYSGDIRHHTPVAPLSVCVVDSYTAVAQTLELNKKDLGSGIGNAGQNVVDTSSASVDGPCNLSTSALELKKQEESLGKLSGPENVGIGHDCSKAPQAAGVVDSDTAATPALELKEKGDDLGPYDAATSALELKEQETSHGGPNSNDIGCDTRDASVDFHVGDYSTTVALTLEVNEKGDYLGIDRGDIGHAIRDAPLAVREVDSETASTTLEVKLKGERLGPVDTEQNVVGSSSAFVDSPCNATLSVLESKEQEESVGPDSGATESDTSGAPPAVFVVNSGTAAAPTLELNEKDLGSEPDNVIADPGARDFPSASVVLNYDAAEESVLAPKENQVACGPGDTENKDARSAQVASSCNAEASTMESKEQEETHGTDDCNADLCLEVSRSDSGEDSALALKVENAPVIDNCDVQRDAVSSPPSVIERNDTTDAVVVRNDTTEVLNTEPLNGTVGDLTQTDAASTTELNVEKTHGRDDGEAENAHDEGKAEDVTGDDQTTSHVLGSDTVGVTTSESKVEKDGHDLSKSEPSS